MTTEQEGKITWDTRNKLVDSNILDEEEDSDPDVDLVSVLPSLWFYWRGLMASMQEPLNTIFF